MNLIERICKCGCGQSFKCLENSGQRYFSKLHMEAVYNKNSDTIKAKIRRSGNPDNWKFKNISKPKSSIEETKDKNKQPELNNILLN
jgi:hypothetical protein